MKRIFFIFGLLGAIAQTNAQYNYPKSITVDSSDTYFGTKIQDPYRWIEHIKDSSVTQWFKAESDYTNSVLDKIPGQQTLIKEWTALDHIVAAKYSPIAKAGGKYFYEKRLPGEPIAKFYYKQGENGKEILLFDPQKFIVGKTMDYTPQVSDDGSRVAMIISEAGTELGDIRILDVAKVQFLSDIIHHSSGSFAGGSNTQLLYSEAKNYDIHDPEVILNTKFKLHIIGQPTSSDIIIVSAKNNPELHILPSEYPIVTVTQSSPYMIFGKYSVENNLTLYYALKSELTNKHINWKPLTIIGNEVKNYFQYGNDIYFLTSKANPHLKIIKTNLLHPDLNTAKTIFEGDNDWKISSDYISQSKDYLIISKSKNELVSQALSYSFKTGKITDIKTPLSGNMYAKAISNDENEIELMNTGWTTPINYYKYDVTTNQFSKGPFYTKIDYPGIENIVYEEVEVSSYDGAMVPLSIVYDKTKLKKDGSNICELNGYGAYGLSAYIPVFTSKNLPLLSRGVVFAYAHVRGGGEKGNDWYLAGKKTTKPNTWKDFNACGEYLIKNNYTSSTKFGVTGASAGGILIGRAITEKPDLYKVAIPKVGCLNTLRMEFSPNGPVNVPEFGTVKDETEFKVLLEMDAYQHIQKGVKYPAQLITTGFNDPRVDSYTPAKFAAKMQADNGSSNPTLLYVDYKAGHFGGSTLQEQYAQSAKEFAFLLWQCGDPEFQVK